jgi:hypothetical protein
VTSLLGLGVNRHSREDWYCSLRHVSEITDLPLCLSCTPASDSCCFNFVETSLCTHRMWDPVSVRTLWPPSGSTTRSSIRRATPPHFSAKMRRNVFRDNLWFLNRPCFWLPFYNLFEALLVAILLHIRKWAILSEGFVVLLTPSV